MSEAGKLLLSFANLSLVMEAATLLADHGCIKREDVAKCVRIYVKKHPEINEHFARLAPEMRGKVAEVREQSQRGNS